LGRQGFCQAYICMGVLFYPDGHSRCYAPGLFLLCRGYRLLEIGFWAFYGCFLMNAIGRRFRPICYVFPAGAMFSSQAAKGFSRSACAVYFCRAALLAECCRLLRKSSSGKARGQVCRAGFLQQVLGMRAFLPSSVAAQHRLGTYEKMQIFFMGVPLPASER